MRRCCGYGRWTLADGSHCAAIGAILAQVTWPFCKVPDEGTGDLHAKIKCFLGGPEAYLKHS